MAKRARLAIENLGRPKEALNAALEQAMTLMQQKGVSEAAVTLTINMEIRDDGGSCSYIPRMKYKTNVRVPMDVKNIGIVTDVSQLYWDQDAGGWQIRIEGEQMKIEG